MPPGHAQEPNKQPSNPLPDMDMFIFRESSRARPPIHPIFNEERTRDIERFTIRNPPNPIVDPLPYLGNPPNPSVVNKIPQYTETRQPIGMASLVEISLVQVRKKQI